MAKLEIPIIVKCTEIDELIDEIKHLQTYKLFEGDEQVLIDRDDTIEIFAKHIRASAQPEQKTFSSMTNIEFEKWLYDHGICHPDVYEFIPCRLVPMLIDNAINELPSAQPEQRWTPCKVQNPKETGLYIVTLYIEELNDRMLDLAWYDEEKGWARYEEKGWAKDRPVIAWMESPILYNPIPYKEEQNVD